MLRTTTMLAVVLYVLAAVAAVTAGIVILNGG